MSRKTEFDERRAEAEGCDGPWRELQENHHQRTIDHVRLAQLAERLKARGEQIVRELAEIDADWRGIRPARRPNREIDVAGRRNGAA